MPQGQAHAPLHRAQPELETATGTGHGRLRTRFFSHGASTELAGGRLRGSARRCPECRPAPRLALLTGAFPPSCTPPPALAPPG